MSTNKVPAEYVYPTDFSIEYISGAVGGFNGTGDFVANFFFEVSDLPTNFEIIVDESGVGRDEYNHQMKIRRDVKAGISMKYETLVRIRDWFTQNIEEIERQRNG
jgi:hypothetical protein